MNERDELMRDKRKSEAFIKWEERRVRGGGNGAAELRNGANAEEMGRDGEN